MLTGANGYIGRRLLPVLVQEGHEVICLVRDKRRMNLEKSIAKKVSYFEADLLKPETLQNFPENIDVAYYLVHSMGSSYKKFMEMEQNAAQNFKEHVEKTKAQQIIFLSGIVNDVNLSQHLASRKKVEDILNAGQVPSTVLRAAIIIGSGGASFEIIRDLVEKLPVMVAPKWLKTKCQPIAVRNVIEYLNKAKLEKKTFGKTFDIGGPDILTYEQMLLEFAKVRDLKRYIISVPVLSPKLSSLWLYFVTQTSFSLARSLVDSMRNEVVVKIGNIQDVIPIQLICYREAVTRAFDKVSQNEVVSSWKDALASGKMNPAYLEFVKVPQNGCFKDIQEIPFKKSKDEVLENVWQIGGERGWYYLGGLWQIRGMLDKLAGGVGLRRGRRSPTNLLAGDALDFWRVLVADREENRLLLYAEMKLPGEAWLEFIIRENDKGQNVLHQTATFRPQGLWGRLYWYSIYPFHLFIFKGMANRIINFNQKAEAKVRSITSA